MKHVFLTILTTLALFAFSGVAQAQVTVELSTDTTTSGDTIEVTLSGLEPGATIKVIVSGVGNNGTEVNEEREVTADDNVGALTTTRRTSATARGAVNPPIPQGDPSPSPHQSEA